MPNLPPDQADGHLYGHLYGGGVYGGGGGGGGGGGWAEAMDAVSREHAGRRLDVAGEGWRAWFGMTLVILTILVPVVSMIMYYRHRLYHPIKVRARACVRACV